MKKIVQIILFSTFAISFCQNVNAEDSYNANALRVYTRIDMGFSIGETKFGKKGADSDGIAEIGGISNIAIGTEIGKSRFEIAYQERESVSEAITSIVGVKSSFEAFAFMANAYYDYLRDKHFAMYVGAGAGADRYHWQTSIWGSKANGRGWSFTGGLYTGISFVFTDIAWDIGLDYYYIREPETNSFVPKTGLRIRF